MLAAKICIRIFFKQYSNVLMFFHLHIYSFYDARSGSDPVRIKSPVELADQTVEERLITFDWERNFHSFQDATRRGAFLPLCWVKTQVPH